MTMRAAVVFIAAALTAIVAVALLLAVPSPWPVALLGGGGAFGVALPLFSGIIPPSEDRPRSKASRGA